MNELLNYQADKIERILAAQGLDVRIVSGTMGPRLTVFHAVKPASIKLAAVMRMDEEIALGLGAPACRIGRTGRHLTIEIPRRDPTTVRLLELAGRVPKRAGAVVLGVDEEDTPLMLSLDSPNVGHVLICGTTGSGKTALARAMIAGLAMSHAVFELGLVLVDPKRRGYVPFAGLPHLVHPVIHEPEEALGVLAGIPTSVLMLVAMRARDRRPAQSQPAQPQPHHYPPVIVVSPGGQQQLPPPYQSPDTMDGDWRALGAPCREFRIIGEE